MRCSLLVCVALAGCSSLETDVPTIVRLPGTSGVVVVLEILEDQLAPGATDFRWAFARIPSATQPMVVQSGSALHFVPFGRGEYWVDRYVSIGVAENLTHRFLVNVAGAGPMAVVDPMELETSAGESVFLDGGQSYSREGLPLAYEWMNGPGPQVPGLPSFGDTFSFIAPNAPGTYRVRLLVKDSFSSAEATANIVVRP